MFFLILLIIFLVIVFLPQESNEFRIRVIAASDSIEDQRQKYLVVKVLQEEIRKYDENDIINEIKDNINLLEAKVYGVLQGRKFSMKISKVSFPTKKIDGEIISGGKYETLLIVIDSGEGKNWWSILYPKYHNISFEDLESGEVEFEFYFFEKIKRLFSD
jgi:hypothetical protein